MKQIRQLAVLFGHMIWHTFWSLVETIEDNAELTENLATKDMPTTEYITLGIGGGYGNCLIAILGEFRQSPWHLLSWEILDLSLIDVKF